MLLTPLPPSLPPSLPPTHPLTHTHAHTLQAHNPPTPALLDAADQLGYLVWDENHRNGQDDQIPLLILRDRNHPSVVIWSLCNEGEWGSGAPRSE